MKIKFNIKEETEVKELNDSGSDTIDKDGIIKSENHEEPEKAQPSDITDAPEIKEKEEEIIKAEPSDVTIAESYSSLKEAFLLREDYFSTDSSMIVTATDKIEKLEKQLTLLSARDSSDPLYEELLRTTAEAKRLQEELQNKYKTIAESKAKELISRVQNK